MSHWNYRILKRGEATCTCVLDVTASGKEIHCDEPAAVELIPPGADGLAPLLMCARHYTSAREPDEPTLQELRQLETAGNI